MADRPRILVIDDNEVDREVVRRFLGSDFEVHEAASATAGFEKLKEMEPDCVLLDYRLPDRDGVEVLEELVAGGWAVVVLTGQGDEVIAVRALKAGALDYVVKRTLSASSLERTVRLVLREVSHRRERTRLVAERDAAEESTRKLAFLLENTPDFVISFDGEGLIRYANPRVYELLGRSSHRGLLGQPVAAIHHANEARRLTETILPRTVREGTWSGELSFRTAEGEQIPTDTVVVVQKDDADQPALFAMLSRDIRARRRLEGQFRQSQKMEAIGRLAGGVAHDFNNALTAIVAFASFADDALDPDHPAKADLAEVLAAAERAERITRQLLEFSRQRAIEPKVVDPNETLRGLARMLERLLGEDLRFELKCRAEGAFKMDVGALEQVVVNLVVNARDAMPHGGTLVVETEDVEIDESYTTGKGTLVLPGHYVRISVSDTGCGIDAETQQRIFEPFFTTKEVGKGTGLGLATVFGMVKQAGGFIWVYSEPNEGTTFRLYFPRETRVADARRPEPGAREWADGRGLVLLVEDDQQIRRLVERTLRRGGFDVVSAHGGEAALEIARTGSRTFDLLLTDVVMPKMSGRQLASKISRDLPELRVAFISGYTADAITNHGVVEEGVRLLSKPFTGAQLLRYVADVLENDGPYAGRAEPLPTVLLVAAEPTLLSETRQALLDDFQVVVSDDGDHALRMLGQSPPDVVLCDPLLPTADGRLLHERMGELAPEVACRVVFITDATGSALGRLIGRSSQPVVGYGTRPDGLVRALSGVMDGS